MQSQIARGQRFRLINPEFECRKRNKTNAERQRTRGNEGKTILDSQLRLSSPSAHLPARSPRLAFVSFGFTATPRLACIAQLGRQIFDRPITARGLQFIRRRAAVARRRSAASPCPESACNGGCASRRPAMKPPSKSPLPPWARCGLPEQLIKISPSFSPDQRLIAFQHHPAVGELFREFSTGNAGHAIGLHTLHGPV